MNTLRYKNLFSLFEVIVVFAITAILCFLIISAIREVRNSEKRTSCIENHKNLTVINFTSKTSKDKFLEYTAFNHKNC